MGQCSGTEAADLAAAVHLWLAAPDEAGAPELVQAYLAMMSPDERERYERFRFPRHRQGFAVAHALVRTALSRYADVPPEAWRFQEGSHGRPEIAAPRAHRGLRFNLSHTDGLVGCAVALERAVGFDVEHVQRRVDAQGIAGRFFSPAEAEALRALPAEARQRRFFDYWTLKEAYVKATGLGLSLPLSTFSFALPPGEPIRLGVDATRGDDAGAWQLALMEVDALHVAALAVRRGDGPDLVVEARRVVPLGPERAPGLRVVARSRPPGGAP